MTADPALKAALQAATQPHQTTSMQLPRSMRPYGPTECFYYYDGPLLFWLPGLAHQNLLAVALQDGLGTWPMLVTELSSTTKEDLLNNRITFRAAVLAGEAWYHLPDYGADKLMLHKLSHVPEDCLPGDVTPDGKP